jgi:hypothetical protein
MLLIGSLACRRAISRSLTRSGIFGLPVCCLKTHISGRWAVVFSSTWHLSWGAKKSIKRAGTLRHSVTAPRCSSRDCTKMFISGWRMRGIEVQEVVVVCDYNCSNKKLTTSDQQDIGQKVPAQVYAVLLVSHFLRSTGCTDID